MRFEIRSRILTAADLFGRRDYGKFYDFHKYSSFRAPYVTKTRYTRGVRAFAVLRKSFFDHSPPRTHTHTRRREVYILPRVSSSRISRNVGVTPFLFSFFVCFYFVSRIHHPRRDVYERIVARLKRDRPIRGTYGERFFFFFFSFFFFPQSAATSLTVSAFSLAPSDVLFDAFMRRLFVFIIVGARRQEFKRARHPPLSTEPPTMSLFSVDIGFV